MNDREATGFLQASSWEAMSTLCEEHRRAQKEYENALLEEFIYPSLEADIRVAVAIVALQRAEGRLERQAA